MSIRCCGRGRRCINRRLSPYRSTNSTSTQLSNSLLQQASSYPEASSSIFLPIHHQIPSFSSVYFQISLRSFLPPTCKVSSFVERLLHHLVSLLFRGQPSTPTLQASHGRAVFRLLADTLISPDFLVHPPRTGSFTHIHTSSPPCPPPHPPVRPANRRP